MVDPSASERRGVALWAGAGAPLGLFIALGLPAGAVGVAWPPIRTTFGAPLAGLGLILAATTVAYFTGSASSGPLGKRFGTALLVLAGCSLAAVGLVAVSLARDWLMIPILGLVLGAGLGLVDATVNAHVSLSRGIRYMGWLHASWAAGAALGPVVVVGSLALTRSWRPAFAIMAATFIGFGLVIAVTRRQWTPASPQFDRLSTVGPAPTIGVRRAIVLLATLLLIAAGLEATAGDWSYTQLTLGRSLVVALASLGATLFWAGLAAGRVALGLVGNRFQPVRVLDASIAVSALATLAFWLSPPLVAAIVALPLLGIAVGVVFPLLISLTPARVGPGMTGHAVGYAVAAGSLGGGALPAAIGPLLQMAGLWTLGPIMSMMAGGLALLHAFSRGGSPRFARPGPDRPVR